MNTDSSRCFAVLRLCSLINVPSEAIEELQELFKGFTYRCEYPFKTTIASVCVFERNKIYDSSIYSISTESVVSSFLIEDHLKWLVDLLNDRVDELKFLVQRYSFLVYLEVVAFICDDGKEQPTLSMPYLANVFFSRLNTAIVFSCYDSGEGNSGGYSSI
jgi:hypothetical protein